MVFFGNYPRVKKFGLAGVIKLININFFTITFPLFQIYSNFMIINASKYFVPIKGVSPQCFFWK